MTNWYRVLFASLLVGGCSTVPIDEESSSHYVPAAGSVVRVVEALQIAPGRTRLYFQFGQAITLDRLNRFYPFCYFRTRHAARPEATAIPAGDFTITRVWRQRDFALTEPLMLAEWRRRVSNSIGPLLFRTHMELGSSAQPDVDQLACGVWVDPIDDFSPHVSIEDMRGALGDKVRLEIDVRVSG